MLNKWRGLRSNLTLLFTCIIVTIVVTTILLSIANQDAFLLKDSKSQSYAVQCKQDSQVIGESRENLLTEKDLWAKLVIELVRKLNSTGGSLININVTNIIQPTLGSEEVLKMIKSKVDSGVFDTQKLENGDRLIDHFKPVMTNDEKTILYAAFIKLTEVCLLHGFVYMMYSGTLLGSYRHHDIVPWDDDFDIFMNYSQRTDIVKALEQLSPEFDVLSAGSRVKFFSTKGTVTSKYPWKWPYIDISFFKENRTHIWDGSMEDDYGDRFYLYHKAIVFPLHKRPMGDYYFYAPRDTFVHLKKTYGPGNLDLCQTQYYSHKFEELTQKTYKIDCKELIKLYPFVYRSPDTQGVRETLKQGDRVIHSLVVEEPIYAVVQPFKMALFTK